MPTPIKIARACIALFFFSGLSHAGGSAPELTTNTISQLTTYEASYETRAKGLSATLYRKLTLSGNQTWQLSNRIDVLFSEIKDSSVFTVDSGQLKPLSYRYKNGFSSKRNFELLFDWNNKQVNGGRKPHALNAGSLDKLSFQEQLRLDLLTQGQQFSTKTYRIVDNKNIKQYRITKLGEETLDTPAGRFHSLKLKQQNPARDSYSLIWLAPNWQYFILKIETIGKDKSEQSLILKSANLNGKPITP